MLKRIFSIITIFTITLSVFSVADAVILNEVIEERVIQTGVTYKHIQRLESYGWQDIYVVSADLKAPGVKLEVLKSKNGESFLENTYKMAQEEDALAAINADFFASKRSEEGRGSAVGVEIRDGNIYSSNSVEENMNTLYKLFDEEKLYINALEFDITLNAANGKTDKIKLINKYDDLTGIVMYTDDWAEKSVGSVGGIIEVSVDKNGKVVEKVTESEPVEIPDGGFVLSAHMSYNTFLLDYVNVGDTISVDIKSTTDLDAIEMAVGGGAVILREGAVPTEFSHNISGRNPRSAVGVDKTGTIITLVAVDGRRENATGMTQTELGYLMSDLGCYTALNLDGGGSTLMAIDSGNGEKEVVNKPSGNYYRDVTNSIGIISTLEDDLPATSIQINANENVFMNTTMEISVTGYDKYGRETKIDTTKVVYTADGKTTKNIVAPSKEGKLELGVKYKTLTRDKTINVLDKPREINFKETKIKLNSGETYIPNIVGKDAEGNMANIPLSDMITDVKGENVTLAGGVIKAEKYGSSVVTAKFGDVTANMVVTVDGAEELSVPENITIPDTQNISKDLYADGAFRFAVFGNTKEYKTMFDQFVANRSIYTMKNVSDFQVFLGADINTEAVEKATENYVFANNYNYFEKENSSFIALPNVSGNIYSYDTTLWTWFKECVDKSLDNVFIFLDRNYITNHQTELKVFKNIVETASKNGKNVYVFGGGFVNKNTVENGVRYINTAGVFPSISLNGTSVSYIKYVLVTVNGSDITYEYKPVFGE